MPTPTQQKSWTEKSVRQHEDSSPHEETDQEAAIALKALLRILEDKPEIWEVRKEAARILFDHARYDEAADLVWSATEIPSIDLEIAFVARTVARATPHRSIRLLKHVLKTNTNNPVKLLAIANALMHYGMVMQAARFYGAATACDSALDNGNLEHFLLWLDDSHHLWGDWQKDGQQLDMLPWVKRDKDKDPNYEKTMSGLTTPIKVIDLHEDTSEHLLNEYYKQLPEKGGEITAPPAVTIPLDQINLDDVLYDEIKGAKLSPSKKSKPKEPHCFEQPKDIPVTPPGPEVKRAPIKPQMNRPRPAAPLQPTPPRKP